MIRAGAISKGACLLMKGEPYVVTEREFVNPGKGQAFVRVKLKSLKSGQTLRETLKSHETVDEAEVEERPAQFLYADDEAYHFMDTETFDQFAVDITGLEHKRDYLCEGESYELIVFEERAIDIKLPLKITLTVTSAPEALRGDTVSGATKQVTLETGLTVKAPLFIKDGDKLLINTETGEYVERVNS